MAYKYKYYRKSIPNRYREQLEMTEYQLSLKDISPKHQTVIKALMEVEFDNVFNRVNEFNKEKLKEYMELVYNKALLDLYGIKSDIVEKYLGIKNKEAPAYTLEEAISLFTKYNTETISRSKSTLKNHSYHNNKLIKVFGLDKDINALTEDDAENFKEIYSYLAPGATTNLLLYINNFMSYLIKKKKILKNPFELLDTPDLEESEKVEFTKKDIKELISSTDNNSLKLAMMIQAYTGMRIGEVVKLKKKNIINLDTIKIDYLKDRGTKKHNREIPIHATLSKALNIYLKALKDEDNLFLTTMSRYVNEHINEIINDKNKSAHSFRRSFRLHMQLKYPDREPYINVLTAHSNKKNIGFNLYGRNQTNWNDLVEMVNSIDYNI